MIGHLAYDDARSGPRPSVLLSHEGPGLDEHVKGRAERLAALGYAAFALDYHGGGVQKPFDEMMAALSPLMADVSITRRRGLAGLDVLRRQDVCDPARIAAIGYCWGGAMSLEIARSGADVQAVVGFHPSLPLSPDTKDIRAAVLLCLGTDDPFVSRDDRIALEQELADAGVTDWGFELYGGVGHSFTNPDVDQLGMAGIAFDARADARSWESMLRLFAETIDR